MMPDASAPDRVAGGATRPIRRILVFVALATAACAPQGSIGSTSPLDGTTLYARVPSQVERFTLTERDAVEGMEADSVYRYTDGSAARVTVIIYEPGNDVRDDPEPDTWTAREGAKFEQVQEIRRRRGQIASYARGFSDTSRVAAGNHRLLEHAAGMPVRHRNGDIFVELQYLYYIGGKFVKVRATLPENIWREVPIPTFARGFAGQLAGSR